MRDNKSRTKMKIMFLLFYILCVSVSADASFSENSEGNAQDDKFRMKIIGKWSEGESLYGISSFEKGGIYKAWAYENPNKQKLLLKMEGTWRISGGKLYNSVNKTTPAIPELNLRDVSIDRIVDITDDVMTLIDEKGIQYVKRKISD